MYTTVDIPLELIPDILKAIKSSDLDEKINRMRFSKVDGDWNFDGLICCKSDLSKINKLIEPEETITPIKEKCATQKQFEEIKDEVDKLEEDNSEKPYYTEPCQDEPCMYCEYMNYDSFHDESWCGHEPSPDGLSSRLLVSKWGNCEYFKMSKFFKDIAS